jgi:hypothetical protein
LALKIPKYRRYGKSGHAKWIPRSPIRCFQTYVNEKFPMTYWVVTLFVYKNQLKQMPLRLYVYFFQLSIFLWTHCFNDFPISITTNLCFSWQTQVVNPWFLHVRHHTLRNGQIEKNELEIWWTKLQQLFDTMINKLLEDITSDEQPSSATTFYTLNFSSCVVVKDESDRSSPPIISHCPICQ